MYKRCTALDNKYGFSENTLLTLKSSDPTGPQCLYLSWIYKQYSMGQFLLEDAFRLRDDLELYHISKARLDVKDRDINSFTYSSLKMLLSEKFYKLEEEEPIAGSNTVVIYDGPYGKLYNPLTEESSCRLGSGTKWCTAARKGKNLFESYNKKGPLYIWIDLNWNKGPLKKYGNGSKKFQFHFETGQYMDELDNEITPELLQYYIVDHPILSQLFRRYENSIASYPEKIVNYIRKIPNPDDAIRRLVIAPGILDLKYAFVNYLAIKSNNINKTPLIMDLIVEYETYMEQFNNPVDIVNYIRRLRVGNINLVNSYIVGNLDREAVYAIQTGKPWDKGDLDIRIVSERKYTLDYITHVKLTRIGEFRTDDIVVRAIVLWELDISIQDLYKESPAACVYYAIHVIRKRQQYIEDMGMSGHVILDKKYHDLFIYGHDEPTNTYELTPKFVHVVHSNVDKFFGPNAPCDRDSNPYDGRRILDTYQEYIRKYTRLEVIEQYLIRYCTGADELMIYMAVNVFGYSLSEALGYIDPNIEDKIRNYQNNYSNIFHVMDDTKHMNLRDTIDYIKINGTSKELLKNILISLEYSYELQELPNLVKILSQVDLVFIYERLPVRSMARFAIYPSISDVRSLELEELFSSLDTGKAGVTYQYYWLKFMGGAEDTRLDKWTVYMDNYKGPIQSEEDKYVQSLEYLKTRVYE